MCRFSVWRVQSVYSAPKTHCLSLGGGSPKPWEGQPVERAEARALGTEAGLCSSLFRSLCVLHGAAYFPFLGFRPFVWKLDLVPKLKIKRVGTCEKLIKYKCSMCEVLLSY